MSNLYIGNAICFAGSVIMAAMGMIKDKKRFLIAQSIMNVFFIAGNLFLGGYSGAIANGCTMLRNIVCLRWTLNTPLKLVFIFIQLAMTAATKSQSVLLWLPVIGAGIFTWYMDTDNMKLLKIIIIITQMMWLVYDIYILNYATVPFDIAACITNSVSLYRLSKAEKPE